MIDAATIREYAEHECIPGCLFSESRHAERKELAVALLDERAHNKNKVYFSEHDVMRLRAEAAERKLAQYRSIRDLLIKALMKATGASREVVQDGPYGAAVKAVAARDALAAALAVIHDRYCPRDTFIPRGGVTEVNVGWIAEQVLDAHAAGWRDR